VLQYCVFSVETSSYFSDGKTMCAAGILKCWEMWSLLYIDSCDLVQIFECIYL